MIILINTRPQLGEGSRLNSTYTRLLAATGHSLTDRWVGYSL
jgi:hypothetical protein